MSRSATIPLFPLNTVLFPGGPLRLRIFEPRYVDMIGRCMRHGAGFGVALIVEGVEAGGPARTANVGTLARIVDFEKMKDGLLGVTTHGFERFSVANVERQSDGSNVAEVTWIAAEPAAPIPEEFSALAELARRAFAQLKDTYGDLQPLYDDATWVGMRLAEVLPLPSELRQQCLEIQDACERLRVLSELIQIARD